MAISAISSIGSVPLLQSTSTAGITNNLQKALQSLQQSLTSGDLTTAKTAFAKVQQLSSSLAASGASPDNQLATDVTALGTALGKSDLTTAKTALTTVQNDVTSTNARAITAAAATANDTAQQIDAILGVFSTGGASGGSGLFGAASSSLDIAALTTSYLSQVYGDHSASSTAATGTKVNTSA